MKIYFSKNNKKLKYIFYQQSKTPTKTMKPVLSGDHSNQWKWNVALKSTDYVKKYKSGVRGVGGFIYFQILNLN